MTNQPQTTLNADKPNFSPVAKLLLVDDNKDDAQLLKRLIGHQYPYLDTVWLQEIEQVLPYLDSLSEQQAALPNMILLDLYMPSARRGLQALQAIKSHQNYKQLPVIVLSRSSCPDDIAQAMNYSADAYVVKPSEPQQWLDELAWLQQYLPKEDDDKLI